jgi:hypothetical protein
MPLQPVSFLDLVPRPPRESVVLDTQSHGGAEIELTALSLEQIADVARRHRGMVKVIDWNVGSLMEHPAALAALIAGALGHLGDVRFEQAVARFSVKDQITLAGALTRLTFPYVDEGNSASPLTASVRVGGEDVAEPEAISPSPSSNSSPGDIRPNGSGD